MSAPSMEDAEIPNEQPVDLSTPSPRPETTSTSTQAPPLTTAVPNATTPMPKGNGTFTEEPYEPVDLAKLFELKSILLIVLAVLVVLVLAIFIYWVLSKGKKRRASPFPVRSYKNIVSIAQTFLCDTYELCLRV